MINLCDAFSIIVVIYSVNRLGRQGASHIVSHPFFKKTNWTWDNIRECKCNSEALVTRTMDVRKLTSNSLMGLLVPITE